MAYQGVGHGVRDIIEAIKGRNDSANLHREQQADEYERQAEQISANIVKLGGKDSPQAKPYLDQLSDVINKHNALYPPHETPALIARIKKFIGRKPGQPTPDPRASMNVDTQLAAAPTETKTEWIPDKNAPLPFKASGGAVWRAEVNSRTGATRWTPMPGVQPIDLRPAGTETLSEEDYAESQRIKAGLDAKARVGTVKAPVARYESGELVGIDDPNTGTSYHAGNITTAPKPIQEEWAARRKEAEEARLRKQAEEDRKSREAEERQQRAFEHALTRQREAFNIDLDKKDYAEAKKKIGDATENYMTAVDRARTMDKNLEDGLKGDQQAMISMVANHIGMTLGAQKGARINKAVWDEAVSSAPWLETLRAKLGLDYTNETGDTIGPKLLAGVKLTPDQMRQMVKLAHEKVEILKQHKEDYEKQYHDALSVGTRDQRSETNKPKPATPPVSSEVDDILKELNTLKPNE